MGGDISPDLPFLRTPLNTIRTTYECSSQKHFVDDFLLAVNHNKYCGLHPNIDIFATVCIKPWQWFYAETRETLHCSRKQDNGATTIITKVCT